MRDEEVQLMLTAYRNMRHCDDELTRLHERLLIMGGLAEERLRMTVAALVERDSIAMQRIIDGDQSLNHLHLEIDARAFTILALQHPMASDLRAVMAAIKINTDLERVGDLVVNIAQAADRYLHHPPVKPLIDIPRMAGLAQTMLRDALDSFVRGDLALAERVLDGDDELDELKDCVVRDVLDYMRRDARTVEPSLELILISRHLERVGDHATNIAEDVIFIVSARDVRHHAAKLL